MNVGISPTQWIASLGIFVILLLAGSQDPVRLYAVSLPKPVALPLFTVGGMRLDSDEKAPVASLSATSVYVLTQENGEILFEHNSSTDYAPASTTKLMTALVVRQLYPLDQVVTIPNTGIADDRQPLRQGQEYSVEQLLGALLVTSNNTAAYALADAHPNGFDGFVADMNKTARLIGLTNTNFTNPAGFDDPSHRSTARDLGQLFRAALRDPLIYQLISSSKRTLFKPDGSVVFNMTNTHQLLNKDPRAIAGKTGTTDEARQVLITLLESGTHPYIMVLLGSSDRYGETRRLADWVDQRYTWQVVTPSELIELSQQVDNK